MMQLTVPSTEKDKCVSLTVLMPFSFPIALQKDAASNSSELQSIATPSNKISITRAVSNGVVGRKICVIAFMARSSNGALSL